MKNDNNEVILNEQLQEALDTVGITPFDEPKIYEVIDSEKHKKSDAIKIVLDRKNLKINDFDAQQIATFHSKVVDKITSLTLEDGTYKSTKATENYKLPNYEEVEAITELGYELNDLYTNRDVDGVQDKVIDILKKMDIKLWEITGLKKDDLTDWEVKLVSEQIFSYTANVEKTSMGKHSNI